MKVFFSPDYVAAAESFDTTRKAGWIAESLQREPVENVEIVPPIPLTFAELAAVHDHRYVESVLSGEPRSLAESQGFRWDMGMWRAATSSNGGVVAAMRAAIADGAAGSLSSGMHHAQHAQGAAFCTFNGLAIAARAALAQGARSVLILDLDAHCGGGTHSLIDGDQRIRQLDVSVNAVDGYWVTGANTLDIVRDAAKYLPVIAQRLGELADGYDLCLYNAGMDPEERCRAGGILGIDASILAERERMVFEWARQRGVPIAFVLAGGYSGPSLSRDELVRLHRLTLAGAAETQVKRGIEETETQRRTENNET